jgi:hypothetical protein
VVHELLKAAATEENAMRIWFVICLLICLLVACKKDDSASIDAPMGDVEVDAGADASACIGTLVSCAGTCVNTTTDSDNCGACGHACTPAASCAMSACACPTSFVAASPPVLATAMLSAASGYVSGVAGVTGSDGNAHAVVVTASATAPLATALAVDNQVDAQVFIALEYEVASATQTRAWYLATAGTVTLSRRCAAGLAGTLHDVALVEVDPATFAAIPGGCTTTLADLAFDIAQPCT